MLSGEIVPTKKPDIDNIAKVILDGLNKLAFKDDNLVSKIEGTYNLNYTITNQAKIEEDINNAVLKSTLTEEENKKLDNLYDVIKTRMESK